MRKVRKKKKKKKKKTRKEKNTGFLVQKRLSSKIKTGFLDFKKKVSRVCPASFFLTVLEMIKITHGSIDPASLGITLEVGGPGPSILPMVLPSLLVILFKKKLT